MPCPQGVDIPGTFAAYNRCYSEGMVTGIREYFMTTALRRESSSASRCVECGKCERHCPQHISIREELEKAAAADGKTLVYPVCLSKTEMIAVRPGPDDDAWTAGAFGIKEPDPAKGEAVRPEDIDLVIAPCSSFDDKCRRLGMGGGYYDRYLPECTKARVIAVAYEVQRADEIPMEEYDKPVDAVITEKTMYDQSRSGLGQEV